MKKTGALSDSMILEMMAAGFIKDGNEKNVQPSSLDLTLTSEIYEVKSIFQPHIKEKVRDMLSVVRAKKHSLSSPLVRGKTYLARLKETFNLPKNIYGYCNPKSTTGRHDIHVRVIADGVPRYDALAPGGFTGEVWIVISPKSYPILLTEDVSLSQLRLFNQDTRFNELELQIAFAKHNLIWTAEGRPLTYEDVKIKDGDGSVLLTLYMKGEVVGYSCSGLDEVLNLSKLNEYKPSRFFKPVKKKGDFVYLEQNKFYILSTNESVRVPDELACEMAPMDERSGEFRSHYAGFIDPGWGFGKDGNGRGRQLTLEVRPFENIVIRSGQPIAKIRFEHMVQVPDTHYDAGQPNYSVQYGPRLAKQFFIKDK